MGKSRICELAAQCEQRPRPDPSTDKLSRSGRRSPTMISRPWSGGGRARRFRCYCSSNSNRNSSSRFPKTRSTAPSVALSRTWPSGAPKTEPISIPMTLPNAARTRKGRTRSQVPFIRPHSSACGAHPTPHAAVLALVCLPLAATATRATSAPPTRLPLTGRTAARPARRCGRSHRRSPARSTPLRPNLPPAEDRDRSCRSLP